MLSKHDVLRPEKSADVFGKVSFFFFLAETNLECFCVRMCLENHKSQKGGRVCLKLLVFCSQKMGKPSTRFDLLHSVDHVRKKRPALGRLACAHHAQPSGVTIVVCICVCGLRAYVRTFCSGECSLLCASGLLMASTISFLSMTFAMQQSPFGFGIFDIARRFQYISLSP